MPDLHHRERHAARHEQGDQRHRDRREAAEGRRETGPALRRPLGEPRKGADPEDEGRSMHRDAGTVIQRGAAVAA